MIKQLKEHVSALQELLQSLKKRRSDRSSIPTHNIPFIDDPDAEFRISLRIVNDLIAQNLPFARTMELDESGKLDLTIDSAAVLTGTDNALHLKIHSAKLGFKRNKLDFGVISKDFELTITPVVIPRNDGRLYLAVYGNVTKFNLRYFPGVMDMAIKEILNLVIPFPLVEIDVNTYLDVKAELPVDAVPIRIEKSLESVALVIGEGNVQAKVKYRADEPRSSAKTEYSNKDV